MCVFHPAHGTPNGVGQTEAKTDYKKFNSKQQHSSVRYMKNKQSEVSQDG